MVMSKIYYCYLASPIGQLMLVGDGENLTGLYLPNHKGVSNPDANWREATSPFADVSHQLSQYFEGQRQTFDLQLKPVGTPFQQQVWQELVEIPFGTTITYAQLAQRIGRHSASRAVGHANSRNPISIVVPCHRVIGADGKLTGYAGGLDKKRWLLDFEGTVTGGEQRNLFTDQPPANVTVDHLIVSRDPNCSLSSVKS